jgi:hypothetical protein
MTNLAHLPVPRTQELYLGPATVEATGAGTVEVELESGQRVKARLALAFAYQPAPGDSVLVLGQDQHYVVGVLQSNGKATLSFPGDLELRAAGGKLSLRGDEGVAVEGPSMQVTVGKLELVARKVTERFMTLRQHVAELLSVQAGESHTVVDGQSYTRAESATLLTKEKVSINGKAIHLG